MLAALLVFISLVYFQDKPADRTAEIRDEIAKLEKRLLELRAELNKQRSGIDTSATLSPYGLVVGKAGTFGPDVGAFLIERIIDEGQMLVRPSDGGLRGWFVLRKPTAGLADGVAFNAKGAYIVSETRRVGTKTYYVLDELSK